MSTTNESIVQKEKPVVSSVNPFARQLEGHVNAGTVAVESERAIAEAQGKLVIAKRFPRDQARAYVNIIEACRRPGLAEEACYSFPRGGEVVSGPAIRLAEMLAANWGNVDYGIRELSRKEGVSEMEAYCWDLETNTMSSQKFTVRHIRDKRGGNVALTDERDIYELTANMGARRLRARILAILPADLVQAAVDQCSKTLASGGDLPMADRIRAMLLAFKTLGVPATLIEKRLGHPVDRVTGEELADLRKIHNSLRDNMSSLTDWFGGAPTDDVQMTEQPKRPEPPPRARKEKGANAVAAAAEAPTTPSAAAAPVASAAPEPAAVAPAPKAEPTPAPPPTHAGPRTTLNDGETLTAICRIVSAEGIIISKKGLGPQNSVSAVVDGEFCGTVFHIGGGERRGEEIVPSSAWKVGTSVNLTLSGKLNTVSKQTLVWVEAIAQANATMEAD